VKNRLLAAATRNFENIPQKEKEKRKLINQKNVNNRQFSMLEELKI